MSQGATQPSSAHTGNLGNSSASGSSSNTTLNKGNTANARSSAPTTSSASIISSAGKGSFGSATGNSVNAASTTSTISTTSITSTTSTTSTTQPAHAGSISQIDHKQPANSSDDISGASAPSGGGDIDGAGSGAVLGSGSGSKSGDAGNAGGRVLAKDKTFKIIKKRMMNVENINKFMWYKSMVSFLTWVTNSELFRTIILSILSVNLILIAVMSNPSLVPRYGSIFELVDLSFLVVYTAEFLMKLLAGPKKFWRVNYNRFDLFILAISYLQVANLGANGVSASRYFLRVFRALRALRALRFISFIRDLQVLFSALLKTFRALAYVLTLLLIILFVGASIAFQIYSTVQPNNPANPYTQLLFGMLTLFCFVTADGWTNIQDDMDDALGQSSRVLTVIILFLGHFMYENLLAGLMIQYMTEADEEEKKLRKQRKLEAINKKKDFIAQQQQQDLESFSEKQKQMLIDQPDLTYEDILTKLAGKQSHTNIVPSSDLACSLTWLELFTSTLHHQEHNMYRMQQLHFEVTKTLAEALERKLHAKIHV